MGSFDAVCGLSNMAIGDGDPVIAMMIRKNPYENYTTSPIYPYNVWQPISMLRRGRYDDYGNVELDGNGSEIWALTQVISQDYTERVCDQPTPISGKPVRAKYSYRNYKLDEGFDASGKRPNLNNGMFSIWMAHVGIWDKLTQKIKSEYFDAESKKFSNKTIQEITDTKIANNKKITETEDAVLGMFIRNPWEGNSETNNPCVSFLGENIIKSYEDGDLAKYEEFILYWRDHFMMQLVLDSIRRALYPVGTIGEQHGNDSPHIILASAVREQAKKNKKKYEDY